MGFLKVLGGIGKAALGGAMGGIAGGAKGMLGGAISGAVQKALSGKITRKSGGGGPLMRNDDLISDSPSKGGITGRLGKRPMKARPIGRMRQVSR